jgi:voltage-gated potassium channel Kch
MQSDQDPTPDLDGNGSVTGRGPGVQVVVGDTPEARLVAAHLQRSNGCVVHLLEPTDQELHERLTEDVVGICILIHDDIAALRYCLTAAHLRPSVPLIVTIFDRTVSEQLRRTLPNCDVMSPAAIALPSLVGPCLDRSLASLRKDGQVLKAVLADDPTHERTYQLPRGLILRGWAGRLLGQLRPHDGTSKILLAGLLGLLSVLVTDVVVSLFVVRDGPVDAIYRAVRTLTTVGPGAADGQPAAYKLFTAFAMLLSLVLTAVFTAGVVQHLLGPRGVALFGRRALPRSGHVIVVGLGQVGLRLAQEIHRLGVSVVVIERDPTSRNILLARASGIPVVIGSAGDRAVLSRLSVRRAVSLASVSSHDLDNIAVAVTARALAPDLPIVLRAGNHDAITETKALFRIGIVRDVTLLTASFVAEAISGRAAGTVVQHENILHAHPVDGSPRRLATPVPEDRFPAP